MASPPEADRGTQTRRPSEDVARGRMSRIDRRWWVALAVVVLGSFAVLGFMGIKINHTYTNNWPHEPLIDNSPAARTWSGPSPASWS
jgi:hypothetical protein